MRSEEGNREGRAGEHMNLKISIGSQDFAFLREYNCFLVDKTDFIKKWWESGDAVTLITRPRRFGKTLNMSMLNCFFSRQYEHRGDLFEGLNIWSDLKYRNIQGSYPVIYLSFADIKQDCYGDTVYDQNLPPAPLSSGCIMFYRSRKTSVYKSDELRDG